MTPEDSERESAKRSQIDFRSRSFRISLSVCILWVFVIFWLSWEKWQDGRPAELSSYNLDSKCFDPVVNFTEEGLIGNRQPTDNEIQSCLKLERRINEREAADSERWAIETALKWFSFWGVLVPTVLLGLVSLRSVLRDKLFRIARAYWNWVNGG